jgi:hypothetical protein
MPGIVNAHMHWHEERQPGMAQPIQYERNLYLAAGVTTAREVGGDFEKSKRWQAESNAHAIVSPRILVYPFVSKGRTGSPAEIRAWIRDIKQRGADGLKIIAWIAISSKRSWTRPTSSGCGPRRTSPVEETTGRGLHRAGRELDRALLRRGDAALDGIQHFPPEMNYANEIHRFGRAGELYAQCRPREAAQR